MQEEATEDILEESQVECTQQQHSTTTTTSYQQQHQNQQQFITTSQRTTITTTSATAQETFDVDYDKENIEPIVNRDDDRNIDDVQYNQEKMVLSDARKEMLFGHNLTWKFIF